MTRAGRERRSDDVQQCEERTVSKERLQAKHDKSAKIRQERTKLDTQARSWADKAQREIKGQRREN